MGSLSPPPTSHHLQSSLTISSVFSATISLSMSNEGGPNSSMASSDWSSQIIPSMDSYDGKVMLAAIISLFLVILFVLLLHIYTRSLLQQAQRQRSRSMSLSHVLGPTRLHHVRTLAYDGPYFGCSSSTDGVDASVIAALPVFVYKCDEFKNGLECVVCLSVFEEDDRGRSLPKCHHAFHVECIDIWLQSHSSCPICRAPVALMDKSIGIGITSSTMTTTGVEESQDASTLAMISGESAVARESSTILDVQIELQLDPNTEVLIRETPPPPPQPPPPPPPPPRLPVSSSSLGCSLKRMLSRNRSECKVFPSSNNLNEFNV